ncbi:MAG: ribonuclease [Sphingomonadales bacterium]|jgi:ribonuclease-3|nr:ribonuclease [Sphingomonadales bacterium]
MDKPVAQWLEEMLGRAPRDPALFERALTHASFGEAQYERLEFLGDRVLGLAIAAWLYELFPNEPEGQMSKRLNALVARETCAQVGRELGVGPRLRLGKQAREDGAFESDNVIGDAVEALIGALYLDSGLDDAMAFIRRAWGDRVSARDEAPQHPKSALQEWAAAQDRKPPAYRMAERSGPQHAPTFVVEVEIRGVGTASAEGASKQEAETAAAQKLLDQLK